MPASDFVVIAGWIAIAATVAAWLGHLVHTIRVVMGDGMRPRLIAEAVLYSAVVTVLSASAVAYLMTRLAYFRRTQQHRRAPKSEIDTWFAHSPPSLTVLVPSFREDARVITQTLLSVALQEYPGINGVLLVDDPPTPSDPVHSRQLEQARAIPGRVETLLEPFRARFEASLADFDVEMRTGQAPEAADMEALAYTYEQAVAALRRITRSLDLVDHTDVFFADHVIGRLGHDLTTTAAALRSGAVRGEVLPPERLRQLYERLVRIFDAKLTSFERKQYLSLSDEPNKAMNLNSYIGLMGRSFHTEHVLGGTLLRECDPAVADLRVPASDYLLTLDADSVILPEYALRLVHFMEQPENDRVAVVQTPYSAYPGSATRLERIAGATTDLQHMVHQGMTRFNATFWVGANAVLRVTALNEIVEEETDGIREVRRYIQDRTPIEDTESSIDLAATGWSLHNIPERLSYSATPPDFGSLCIQRQRWANGGLLMIPKLFHYLRSQHERTRRDRLTEALLRLNYLGSICWATFGLVLLLAYPFNQRLLNPFVLVAALPYFVATASDLRRCGYKRLDVLRIYGFNLILIPVNLSGVLKSLGQAITHKKLPFARTPKVRDRTTAQLSFVGLPYVLVAFSLISLWRDVDAKSWGHAAYAGANGILSLYAIAAFVGFRNSLVDLWINFVPHLYKPAKQHGPAPVPVASRVSEGLMPEWAQVLHQGSDAVPDDWATRAMGLPATRRAHVEAKYQATTGAVPLGARRAG